MALVVDKADLLLQELFKGLRQSWTTQYLALLGGSTLIYLGGKLGIQILNGLRIHFLPCTVNLKEKYGTWAVVTGCTNGIGRALAVELAARGLNIVLIARNPIFLEELSQYLETSYKVQTKVIVADFKDGNVYEKIKEQLGPISKDLGILINNVGMADNKIVYYSQVPDSLVKDMINTNICSVALMSKIALEPMVAKGRGAILNVSSVAGIIPFPFMTIYSATKAFVNHFSLNLHHEYSSKGILVQNLTPMGIRTKMLKDIAMGDESVMDNCMTPTAVEYAQNVIRTLGKTRETTGYWRHSLMLWCIGLFPVSCFGTLSRYLTKARLKSKGIKLD